MNNQEQITCWFCSMSFSINDSSLCSHTVPTHACPYCLNCSCTAPEQHRDSIRETLDQNVLKKEQNKQILFSKPIGSILVETGLITQIDLETALIVQKRTAKPLGEVLVQMGLLSEDIMRITLLNQQWIEQIDLEGVRVDLRLLERFGLEFCCRHHILPIELMLIKDNAILRIAIANRETLEAIRAHPAFQTFGLLPYLASQSALDDILNKIKAATQKH